MEITQTISQLVSDSLQTMGYAIVRVKLMENERRSTLQIMLERIDGDNITVKNCEQASRQISAILDVEDPIKGEYNLEISSPGIDRPLTRRKDFELYAENEIKLSTAMPIDGRKHFKGMLLGIENDTVKMAMPETHAQVDIPFESITAAKLILTDKLLKAANATSE